MVLPEEIHVFETGSFKRVVYFRTAYNHNGKKKKKLKRKKSQLLIAVNILLLSFENCICLCDHPLRKICVAMFMEAVYVQICEICTVTST